MLAGMASSPTPVPCGLVHPELVVGSRGMLPCHQSGSQGAIWLSETQQPSELEGGAREIRGGPFERSGLIWEET